MANLPPPLEAGRPSQFVRTSRGVWPYLNGTEPALRLPKRWLAEAREPLVVPEGLELQVTGAWKARAAWWCRPRSDSRTASHGCGPSLPNSSPEGASGRLQHSGPDRARREGLSRPAVRTSRRVLPGEYERQPIPGHGHSAFWPVEQSAEQQAALCPQSIPCDLEQVTPLIRYIQ